MGLLFFASWAAQSLGNWREFNAELLEHDEATVSWGRYLLGPDFWERTLENWQSEFLAVGTLAVFTIYLRQRGSPESKPVGAPARRNGIVRLAVGPGGMETQVILAVDIGGSHVKFLTSAQVEARRFDSGPELRPQAGWSRVCSRQRTVGAGTWSRSGSRRRCGAAT